MLAGNSLRYYKDAKAEDANELDGRIDLSTCYEVSELNIHRNYGFKIKVRHHTIIKHSVFSVVDNNHFTSMDNNNNMYPIRFDENRPCTSIAQVN